MGWRDYHGFTKHSVESLRRSPHYLDWANMPNPFRHYEGVPLLDLPADPPQPKIPAMDVLEGQQGFTAPTDGSNFLSQLLFYSASISASKRAPSNGTTYALRVNPSSGNLHPTEFHFCTRGLLNWPDGLYHYRPSSHMAEQRAVGDFISRLGTSGSSVVFLLTTIAWREAWKYRDRAYRYCLHDLGHAWQSLALAARAMGCESSATGHFCDDDVAKSALLNDDEWPMLIVTLRGAAIPVGPQAINSEKTFGGEPNRLSDEQIAYPRIDEIHNSTKLQELAALPVSANANTDGLGEIILPTPAISLAPFGGVARQRRSALDFRGGEESMSLAQLSALLSAAAKPLFADFEIRRFVQLCLYIHRVDGLLPGVYRYCPATGTLENIKSGDQRVAAAALSLGQELAGNACVAFSMIGDFESAAKLFGNRGYRYVHFEAGAIGQRLYLTAESLGLRATGIGAFYDDEVHRYLSINAEQGQVVYHFAVGHPVPDLRLEA